MASSSLIYRLAKPEDHNDILAFLITHFITQEPLAKAVGLTRESGHAILNECISDSLADPPVSFLCLNEQGKIVGCRLNKIFKLDEHHDENGSDVSQNGTEKQISQGPADRIGNFLDLLISDLNRLIPANSKVMKFIIVSVDSAYQNRGIASELVRLSVEKAKEMNCHFVCTQSVAYRSQKLFEKLGFETLKVIEHKDYLDEHGKQIFHCDDGTICGKLMVKKL